jgi:ABC-type multidrug transport system ATPase subunit
MAAAEKPARLGYLEYLEALQSYCGPLPAVGAWWPGNLERLRAHDSASHNATHCHHPHSPAASARVPCCPPRTLPADVVYKDLTYVVEQSASHGGSDEGSAAGSNIPTVPGFFLSAALAVPKAAVSAVRTLVDRAKGAAAAPPPPKQQLRVLDGVTGRLRPGSATLLLAPPGAGKSAFLKILSQRLPSTTGVSGSVSFAGLPMMAAATTSTSAGAHSSSHDHHVERPHVPRLVALCPQADEHFPGLTVRETLSFAVGAQAVPPVPVAADGGSKPPPPHLDASVPAQVDRLLSLLHLEECADTIIGNESERGISGGQRKRVTVAEALAGLTHRVLLLDEFSTGLDAAVTLELTAALREWARRCRGTLVAAMLQPTPETYALFDDVLLLMEGRVVYHGPREELPGYLRGLGFALPPTAADGGAGGSDHGHGGHGSHGHGHHGHHDFADWLTELLTHPAKTQQATLRQQALQGPGQSPSEGQQSPAAPSPPLTTAALADAWAAHPLSARLMEGADAAGGKALSSSSSSSPSPLAATPFARRAFCRSHARSTAAQLALLSGRQWRLTRRDSPVIFAKSLGGLVMGAILGSLFWQTGTALNLKLGCILFALIHIAFGEGISVPIIINQRHVVYKHVAAGLFSPFSYIIASVAGGALPVSVLETVIFSSVLYWMAGFSPEWYRFLFWILCMLVTALGEGQYFRAVALAAPRAEMGNVLTNPVVGIQTIMGGYLIAESLIPRWLIEFFWLSPISWSECWRAASSRSRRGGRRRDGRARRRARTALPHVSIHPSVSLLPSPALTPTSNLSQCCARWPSTRWATRRTTWWCRASATWASTT